MDLLQILTIGADRHNESNYQKKNPPPKKLYFFFHPKTKNSHKKMLYELKSLLLCQAIYTYIEAIYKVYSNNFNSLLKKTCFHYWAKRCSHSHIYLIGMYVAR